MSSPISLSQTTLAVTTGEKSRARRTMRGRRSDPGERSGACACSSASASSGLIGVWRRDWKRAKWSASVSGSMRLTEAAYLMAETSVSADRLLLSSATTRRPSAPSPSTETRSRGAPPLVGTPSNSKVMTLTAGPRMAGFDSTHSCKSARCSRPASSSEIICAGIATEPATVKSISSAISQDRLGQTVVFPQVPKVTARDNGTTKLKARRITTNSADRPGSPHVASDTTLQRAGVTTRSRDRDELTGKTEPPPKSQRIVQMVCCGDSHRRCAGSEDTGPPPCGDSDRRSRRHERPWTLALDHVRQVEQQLFGVP